MIRRPRGRKAGAGVTHATAQQMLVRGLVDRDRAGVRYKLTPLGRSVFDALDQTANRRAGWLIEGTFAVVAVLVTYAVGSVGAQIATTVGVFTFALTCWWGEWC